MITLTVTITRSVNLSIYGAVAKDCITELSIGSVLHTEQTIFPYQKL